MPEPFGQLGIALLLGLLVGLQREHAAAPTGLRSFSLVTVLGAVMAILGQEYGGWGVAAGLLAVVAILVVARLTRPRPDEDDPPPGTTTDAAALVMYGVGALLVAAPLPVGVAVGGGVAVLLQFKPELHRFARALGDRDLRGIMQFVLITCIILPVLPRRTFGPWNVFNPFETWLMVVLIVGMSLGGYITYKFFGHGAGILLGGLLGGAISSTATTASYARQARTGQIGPPAAAIVILIASTVVFVRVLIEIAVVAPEFLETAAAPVAILMLLAAIPSLVAWRSLRRQPATMPEQENPTQLKSAVLFAGMYALVLLALAAAREYAGREGLYAVAALSGLTDMDAITLSTARLFREGDSVVARDGWRMLVVAGLANLAFKAAVVGLTARRQLLGRVLLLFLFPAAGAALLLLFWPGG